MEKKQILGFMGSILLIVGLFLPIARVLPLSTNVNYFGYGNTGKAVLGLATISLILILLKKYKALWLTGLVSLGLVVYDLYDLQSLSSKATLIPGYERFDASAAVPPEPFYQAQAEAHFQFIRQSVEFKWAGWTVMITGAILIIVSALLAGLIAGQQDSFVSTIQLNRDSEGDPKGA